MTANDAQSRVGDDSPLSYIDLADLYVATLARAQRAEADRDGWVRKAYELDDLYERAEADAARLREALEFYAEEIHYVDGVVGAIEPSEWQHGQPVCWTHRPDGGDRARAALTATGPEEVGDER